MPYIHPAALAHELRRWMRPDAHRFISPSWRRVVQPGSEAAAIFSRYEAKYRPDQPRVPKGVPEGGQWTDDGGAGGSGASQSSGNGNGSTNKPAGSSTPGVVMSDATPDPVRPGSQYEAVLEIDPSAVSGDTRIDSTTVKLDAILGNAADVVDGVPGLTPQEYGRLVHERFADTVRVLGLPGIGYDDVETTFGGAYYGAKGSVRTDVVLRDDAGQVIAIYDIKTGKADVSPARAAELRIKVGVDNSVPVFSLKTYKIERKCAV